MSYTHSRTSSRDSRRSRSSTESHISRYSDDELLEEMQRRGLVSTGESRRSDEDRQSSGSHSRRVDEEYHRSRSPPEDTGYGGCCGGGGGNSSKRSTSGKPPRYPMSAKRSLITPSQQTTPKYGSAQRSPLPQSQNTTPMETPSFGPTPNVTPPDTPMMYVFLHMFCFNVTTMFI